MKRITCLLTVWTCLSLSMLSPLHAQTYPDYSLFGITPQTSKSLVRSYDNLHHFEYYQDATTSRGFVCYSDNMGAMKYFELSYGYEVYDMQIANDYLFMCGQYTPTASAFLASVHIPSITGLPVTMIPVKYQVSNNASILHKLVAYIDGNGDTRVVSIGSEFYIRGTQPSILVNNNYSNLSEHGPCIPGAGYSHCEQNLLFEFVNPQGNTNNASYNFIPINSNLYEERIEDLVVTDNYVALIGKITSNPADLIVRPCDKNNVISTFYYAHRFPLTNEGDIDYVCCHLSGDTIAIANMGEQLVPGSYLGDIRIRIIELSSMSNIISQALGFTGFKPVPLDMVYIPGKSTLVLLADMIFPPSGSANNHAFIYIEPYNTYSGGSSGGTPFYVTNGFCEWKYGLTFNSIDRINGETVFLASGGDYWILKDVTRMQTSPSCYWPDLVKVQKIENLIPILWVRSIDDCFEHFIITDVSTRLIDSAFPEICTIP